MRPIDRFYNGDKLSDEELRQLADTAESARQLLLYLGERFRLAEIEAGRIAKQCYAYLAARG